MITTKNSVGRRKTEVGSWKQSVFGIPTLIFLLALFLFSCDNNKVFDQYIEVENGDWKRENVAKFTVNISDTTSAHNLYINVRNKGNYPFSNL